MNCTNCNEKMKYMGDHPFTLSRCEIYFCERCRHYIGVRHEFGVASYQIMKLSFFTRLLLKAK